MALERQGDYAKKKAAGRCVRCGKLDERVSAGRALCEKCYAYHREYYAARKRDFLSRGICQRCGKEPVVPGRTLGEKCAERQRVNTIRWQMKKENRNGTENTKNHR